MKELRGLLTNDSILMNEPMSKHTSFRVGGAADLFLVPKTSEDFRKTIALCNACGVKAYIIGNGSNLVVADSGLRGAVISTLQLKGSELVDEVCVKAYCGEPLSRIAAFCLDNLLSGVEFAAGIPGSFGGAVYMNAGAYGSEISNYIESAEVVDENGNITTLPNSELCFGYRTSVLQKNSLYLLSGILRLATGDKHEIAEKMKELNRQRAEKQPLDKLNAGSTFKRPQNNFAGKLIMESGLSGKTIGGAQVSEKHCGFIINRGDATAEDISKLIEAVRNTVYSHSGVFLETEVKMLGFD